MVTKDLGAMMGNKSFDAHTQRHSAATRASERTSRGAMPLSARSTPTLAIMSDRSAINEHEVPAREALVRLAAAMLNGNQSFFERAVEVLRLKSALGGAAERDPDFDAFVVMESETDHLPLEAQRHLWNTKALADLQPKYERTEVWLRRPHMVAIESQGAVVIIDQ